MSSNQVLVPDIGDFKDVEVIEVLVAQGDNISKEDPLLTLETDKAIMEIPSPVAGVVAELKVKAGDKVSEGSLVLLLAEAIEDKPEVKTEVKTEVAVSVESAAVTASAAGEPVIPPSGSVYASPSIRKMARTLGVDLSQVKGSGPRERITKKDLEHFVRSGGHGAAVAQPTVEQGDSGMGAPKIPAVDFSKFGPIVEQPLSRIQKISGSHLHRAWLNIPMVTHHDEADITELEAFRKALKNEADQQNVRVTTLTFILKVIAQALKKFPRFSSSLLADGEALILKQYYHVGVAVDTPNGLMVPVIRDVDQKSIYELSRELSEVSLRAREGKLAAEDLQGGCISISSLGGIGGTAFTPIVNVPEVAILGVTRAATKPVWNGEVFKPRLILPLDLTYDHRVIDGAEAARFVAYLCSLLSDLRRLLL